MLEGRHFIPEVEAFPTRGQPVAKIDRPILLEIVRVVQSKGCVPDHVTLQKRRFSITYLEDHRQRIEEALRRQDAGQLNMLFGQLESKVKYQAVKGGSRGDAAPLAIPARPPAKAKARAAATPAAKKKKVAEPKGRTSRDSSRPATRTGAAPPKARKSAATKTHKPAAARAKKAKSSRSR
ncbi:MAG TPA: hypothetical protein VEB21_02575 [Terriglobales bacterium]|nr:hypothetical protein [Terriglobales bacterium]